MMGHPTDGTGGAVLEDNGNILLENGIELCGRLEFLHSRVGPK